MLTWIVVDDFLKNWTASTENNLMSFELSLIIRDQGHIRVFSFLVKLLGQMSKMLRKLLPGHVIMFGHPADSDQLSLKS